LFAQRCQSACAKFARFRRLALRLGLRLQARLGLRRATRLELPQAILFQLALTFGFGTFFPNAFQFRLLRLQLFLAFTFLLLAQLLQADLFFALLARRLALGLEHCLAFTLPLGFQFLLTPLACFLSLNCLLRLALGLLRLALGLLAPLAQRRGIDDDRLDGQRLEAWRAERRPIHGTEHNQGRGEGMDAQGQTKGPGVRPQLTQH
jgi:hypothetical protein